MKQKLKNFTIALNKIFLDSLPWFFFLLLLYATFVYFSVALSLSEPYLDDLNTESFQDGIRCCAAFLLSIFLFFLTIRSFIEAVFVSLKKDEVSGND